MKVAVEPKKGDEKAGDAPADESEKFRRVYLNDEEQNGELITSRNYSNNVVTTSKYTVKSFLFKNLLEFFRVIANVYFLVISVLQVGTDLSPTSKYTTVLPLTIVFILTMVKQGIEDYKRHQADHRMNNRNVQVVRGGVITDIPWAAVRVGDLLKLHDRDECPADIVLLATSEEEGRCFIETSNLDGETNLKRRAAVEQTAKAAGWRPLGGDPLDEDELMRSVSQLRGYIVHELPNNLLYNFDGRLTCGDEEVPLGINNIVLRGCMVRSCSYVFGLVVFTGPETKLMQNSRETPSKQSNVYKMVNRCIFIIFFCQFVLCLISTIGFSSWSVNNSGAKLYLPFLEEQSSADVINSFFTFLILFNNLVPISLYVSLDMVKVVQAKFIGRDPKMYHEESKRWAVARTSDLNEDLGQIEYIFSDKTGTLTRNQMEFRKCSIGGVAYGFGTTEIGLAAAARRTSTAGASAAGDGGDGAGDGKAEDGGDVELGAVAGGDDGKADGGGDGGDGTPRGDPRAAQVHFDPSIHFDDPRLLEHLRAGDRYAADIDLFITLLAVCHTVIPEADKKTGQIAYRASSPDEEALVKAAKCLGYDFRTAAPRVLVEVSDGTDVKEKVYEVLNVNEFNSTRKRMSVVVRFPDGKLWLLAKGADNVMLARSSKRESTDVLEEHLRQFASEGLRTLVLCARELSTEEYEEWNAKHEAAACALEGRDRKLMNVAELIEHDMNILGATAIEDKLQVGVPAAIADMAEAGIKIWVLTGDKQETAINIGYACRLLTNDMQLIYMNAKDAATIEEQINRLHDLPELQKLITARQTSEKLALVVDGQSLVYLFKSNNPHASKEEIARSEELSAKLLDVARCCKAVVACRVSPSQKADIVTLVRQNVKPMPMTLAIGDGANDVGMIQTAHVGIGISGMEGVQAVNASDYAIAQFRFLKQLLLVHGRSNYKRISKVILYSFYKNSALVLVLFFYNFYNAVSGTTLFESFVMAGWNFFLALPIIAIGCLDTDIQESTSLSNPAMYVSGQWNLDLNHWRFIEWIVNSVVHAIISYYIPLGALWALTEGDLFIDGTIIYSCLLMTMNLKVAVETLSWTRINWFVFLGSIFLYALFLVVYPAFLGLSAQFYWVSYRMMEGAAFWFLLILVPTTALIYDYILKYIRREFMPHPGDILMEREKGYLAPSVDGASMRVTYISASGDSRISALDEEDPIMRDPSIRDMSSRGHTGYAFNFAVTLSEEEEEAEEDSGIPSRYSRRLSHRGKRDSRTSTSKMSEPLLEEEMKEEEAE
eukprot:PLAT4437.5.p2 GENE.PLAT4437.5~~PLAT4437.5.p2  ORF type:complete len:1302 (-),score=768.67 PLAT4437.5:273-4115(-)